MLCPTSTDDRVLHEARGEWWSLRAEDRRRSGNVCAPSPRLQRREAGRPVKRPATVCRCPSGPAAEARFNPVVSAEESLFVRRGGCRANEVAELECTSRPEDCTVVWCIEMHCMLPPQVPVVLHYIDPHCSQACHASFFSCESSCIGRPCLNMMLWHMCLLRTTSYRDIAEGHQSERSSSCISASSRCTSCNHN